MSINQSTGSNVEWSSITGYNATISKIVYNAAHYYTECKFSDLKFYDSSGLISEYKFNEGSGTTLTDSAGSNDGIIIGATWEFTTEKNSTEAITFTTPTPTRELEIGRGNLELGDIETRYLSYDIADYVDVPTMNMGDTYTIEATFLYTLDSGSITIPVFGKEKIITLEALPSNPWRFCTGNGSSWGTLVNANTTLSINTIYHIAVVVNSNSVSLYLDGESDGSGTVSNNFNTDFYLTRRMNFDNNDYSFAGNIYDFRLWNKALSQSKLNANITGGETDLALWYSDEGTDSVLTDKAGSNDGTITGATWRILTDSELEELGGLKTEEVLHWTPSSDSGYYWVLTEDEIGNTVYVKVAGTWVEGQLFIKVDGSWKQAEPNVKVSGTWK
jgi:hypothetical protein